MTLTLSCLHNTKVMKQQVFLRYTSFKRCVTELSSSDWINLIIICTQTSKYCFKTCHTHISALPSRNTCRLAFNNKHQSAIYRSKITNPLKHQHPKTPLKYFKHQIHSVFTDVCLSGHKSNYVERNLCMCMCVNVRVCVCVCLIHFSQQSFIWQTVHLVLLRTVDSRMCRLTSKPAHYYYDVTLDAIVLSKCIKKTRRKWFSTYF